MGVAARLHRQARSQPVLVLPQLDPGVVRQRDELAPGFLIQPRVGRVRDVLFPPRGIDGDSRQAVVINRTRCAPGVDRLGQKPFGPSLQAVFKQRRICLVGRLIHHSIPQGAALLQLYPRGAIYSAPTR